jgi:hypothetical protein
MKHSKTVRTLAVLAIAAAAAVGCGRGRDVNVYEPGVYKGGKDPLVSTLASGDLQARLRERFSTGQTDR